MIKNKAILLFLMFFNLGANAYTDKTITGIIDKRIITIKGCVKYAGAICSLTWKGKEFIDRQDFGRLLQSSSNFTQVVENPEVFNPTEGGSRDDYLRTSSKLLGLTNTNNNILRSRTQMAFWINPKTEPNILSDHIYFKRVRIGNIHPNVIEVKNRFDVPPDEHHNYGTFEVLTAYMPTFFSLFYKYDLVNNVVSTLDDGPGEQEHPIIFTNKDKRWAMGIFSPVSKNHGRTINYGRWRYPGNVVKWNAVHRSTNPIGFYIFTSYVIVGNFETVKKTMRTLYENYGE